SCHVRWIDVPEHQRSALGNRNCTLGGLAPLGRQVRSATTTFGVHVGPLPQVAFLDFLPGGSRRAALCNLLDRLETEQLDCMISVEIVPAHAYGYCLGSPSGGLGWTTWLGEESPRLAQSLGDTVSHTLYRPTEESMVA
ncbi:MAG TPA: type VI secretion system baseplate subunit TssG, partial [Planctomycetota bacterium]|nr:type VI secretion system baseplate subunit TssG [Planctomycetota bacterium]